MEGRGREGRAKLSRGGQGTEGRIDGRSDATKLRDKDFFFALLDLPPSPAPLRNPLVTICTSAIFFRSSRAAHLHLRATLFFELPARQCRKWRIAPELHLLGQRGQSDDGVIGRRCDRRRREWM